MKIIIKNDEKWKNIKGYDGKYQISNKGRVKNTENNTILSQLVEQNGVPYIYFSYNKKQKKYQIKNLVATYFLKQVKDKPSVITPIPRFICKNLV